MSGPMIRSQRTTADPLTLVETVRQAVRALAAALLVGVGLLAMWLPTRRALAVDLAPALRRE